MGVGAVSPFLGRSTWRLPYRNGFWQREREHRGTENTEGARAEAQRRGGRLKDDGRGGRRNARREVGFVGLAASGFRDTGRSRVATARCSLCCSPNSGSKQIDFFMVHPEFAQGAKCMKSTGASSLLHDDHNRLTNNRLGASATREEGPGTPGRGWNLRLRRMFFQELSRTKTPDPFDRLQFPGSNSIDEKNLSIISSTRAGSESYAD